MFILLVLSILSTSLAFPIGTSIQTNVLTPFGNLGEIANQKISSITQSKALFGTFPDSGKKQAVLETESLTSQLDSKYTNLQHFVANLLNPKPIVDTIQEHEKFGNDGDKLRSFGTAVIGKFEGFSNVLNTAVDIPFEKAKQVGKKITNSLNAVGGKLVGL